MKSLRRICIFTAVLALMVCIFAGLGATAQAASPVKIKINGITLGSGWYLKEGATQETTGKPRDNYAYYNNGVLTLHNFDVTSDDDKYCIESTGDLTISLAGNNTLTQKDNVHAINVAGNLTITGGGNLTIKSETNQNYANNYAIYVSGDMAITSGNLSVSGTARCIFASGNLTLANDGGTVSLSCSTNTSSAAYAGGDLIVSAGTHTITNLSYEGIAVGGNASLTGGTMNIASYAVGLMVYGDATFDGLNLTGMSTGASPISVLKNATIKGNTQLALTGKSHGMYVKSKLEIPSLENKILCYSNESIAVYALGGVTFGDGIAASMSDNRDGSSPKAFDISKTSTRYVYIRPAAVTVSGIGMYPGDYLKQGDTAASTYKISSGSYAALTGDSGSYQLELNNFTVQSGNYGIQSTGALSLKLNGTNKLTSSSTGVRVESGDLTVSGSGSLQVTSSQNYTSGSGFDVRNGDYLHEGGTVTITSARYGVKAKNDIIVKSGALTANSELGWGAYSKNLYVTGGSARLLGAMSAVYYTGEFN